MAKNVPPPESVPRVSVVSKTGSVSKIGSRYRFQIRVEGDNDSSCPLGWSGVTINVPTINSREQYLATEIQMSSLGCNAPSRYGHGDEIWGFLEDGSFGKKSATCLLMEAVREHWPPHESIALEAVLLTSCSKLDVHVRVWSTRPDTRDGFGDPDWKATTQKDQQGISAYPLSLRFGALDGLKHFFRRLFAGEQRGDGVRESPTTGRVSPTNSEQESFDIIDGDSQLASIEDTKAAMAKMRRKLVARQIDLLSFTTSAKNIARQFSASRKNKSADAWFAEEAYCLLEFGEWVCLLSKSDSEIEPDEDVYYGGLLAGMIAELSDDVLSPLYVRFFKDRMVKPDEEKRGHHTLNVLHLIATRLPKIEGLSLDYFRLRDLNSVATFGDLKAFSIAGCRAISDFSPLSELASLEVLRLDNTRVCDLSPLAKLRNLRVLSLIDCAFVTDNSIRVLAQGHAKGDLGSLESLRLRGTSVTGLTNQILERGSPVSIFSAIYPAHPQAHA